MSAPRGGGQSAKKKIDLTPSEDNRTVEKPHNYSRYQTDAIDKDYHRFLKEEGKTIKHGVQPNLNRATARATTTPRPQAEITPPTIIINGEDNTPTPTDDWRTVKKSTRQPKNPTIQEVRTNNSYEELEIDTAGPTQEENNPTTPRIQKIPTLYLYVRGDSAQIKELTNMCTEANIDENAFRLNVPRGSSYTTITTKTVSTYQLIKDTLKNKNIQFYTHTPEHLKPKSMVLKGIHGGFDSADIEKEIKRKKDENLVIKKVFAMKTRRTNNGGQSFIVQIDHSNKISELTKIKFIPRQTAIWEPLRKQKLFQCRKCQRFGHASANCYLQFRCVKYGQDHAPNECPISKEASREELTCANCQQKGHPASYKGCPYYKNAINYVKKCNQKKNQLSKLTTHNSNNHQRE